MDEKPQMSDEKIQQTVNEALKLNESKYPYYALRVEQT